MRAPVPLCINQHTEFEVPHQFQRYVW